MNQPSVFENYEQGLGTIKNNIMVGTDASTTFRAGSGVNVEDVENYFMMNNTFILGPYSDEIHNDLGLNPDIFYGSKLSNEYPSNPDFRVTSGLLSTGALFTHNKFSETHRSGFFDEVDFIGAFGDENWTEGWTEFDPVDKEY